MMRHRRLFHLVLLGALALGLAAPNWAARLDEARIYIEYNSSDNDLGFHVFLDGEDWKSLKITNPLGNTIFQVAGKGPFGELGLTELFFEGAEPSLDDVPLGELLGRFPEGDYRFIAETVDGVRLMNKSNFSHAIPEGPVVSAVVSDDEVTITWEPVTGPPDGFPDRAINIVGYQVIVGSFQVTLPASSTSVVVPEAYVASLGRGGHGFEVLAIEAGGNQTISSGSFELE